MTHPNQKSIQYNRTCSLLPNNVTKEEEDLIRNSKKSFKSLPSNLHLRKLHLPNYFDWRYLYVDLHPQTYLPLDVKKKYSENQDMYIDVSDKGSDEEVQINESPNHTSPPIQYFRPSYTPLGNYPPPIQYFNYTPTPSNKESKAKKRKINKENEPNKKKQKKILKRDPRMKLMKSSTFFSICIKK